MKKKLITLLTPVGSFIEKNKSTLSLFAIMLVMTLLASAICSLFDADELTKVVVSASVGIITLMGIGSIEDLIRMKLGDNKRPAVLGIIVGVWIILL